MRNILLILFVIILSSIAIFDLVIPIFYLRYINKMKKTKCECSQGFNRKFILGYSIYVYITVFVLVLISLMIPSYKIEEYLETPTRYVISTGIAFLIGYFLFQYQKQVYENSCECAVQTWEPKVMRVHSYIIAVIVLVSMLNIITLLGGRKPYKSEISKSLKNMIKKNNL